MVPVSESVGETTWGVEDARGWGREAELASSLQHAPQHIHPPREGPVIGAGCQAPLPLPVAVRHRAPKSGRLGLIPPLPLTRCVAWDRLQ